MRCKVLFGCVFALMLTIAAAPASAQVTYAGHQDHPRFSVGGAFSTYNMDWGGGYVLGGTVWADWHPPFMDGMLHDFSIEAEARDLSGKRGTYPTSTLPQSGRPELPRTDTIGGGLLYHPQRFRFHRFEPYAKGLISYGSIDFTLNDPYYSHDTRTLYALGGGVNYRVSHRITARVDYEYQFWPDLLGNGLNPQGFSFGAAYNFGGHWR